MIISDIKIQMEEVNNLMQKKLEKEKNKIEQANKEINITIEQQQQIELLKSNIAKKKKSDRGSTYQNSRTTYAVEGRKEAV